MEESLDGIEARMVELREFLLRQNMGAALTRIFALNNEIGWAFRNFPTLKEGLFDLQTKVNLITMSIKAREWMGAEDALDASLGSIREMKQASVSKKDL